MELMMEYMGKGFVVMLMIAMPSVLTAAGIGLIVGILQAVTQVQEQTIAAAPKILGVFLVIIIMGYGYVKLLTNLLTDGTNIAFNIIPKEDTYVLPSDYYRYTKPFSSEMHVEGGDINYIMRHPGKIPFVDNKQKVKYTPSNRMPSPKPNLIEAKKIIGR